MQPNDYQQLADRTVCSQPAAAMRIGEGGSKAIQLFHAALGISAEGGEIWTEIQRSYWYNKGPLDEVNIKEELGDLLWYTAEMCNALGLKMEDVMEANIAKLKKRYPEKYTDELAAEENRDRTAERKAVQLNQNGLCATDDGVCYEAGFKEPRFDLPEVNDIYEGIPDKPPDRWIKVSGGLIADQAAVSRMEAEPWSKQSAKEFVARETGPRAPMSLCPACKGPLSDELVRKVKLHETDGGGINPHKCPNCLAVLVFGELV